MDVASSYCFFTWVPLPISFYDFVLYCRPGVDCILIGVGRENKHLGGRGMRFLLSLQLV